MSYFELANFWDQVGRPADALEVMRKAQPLAERLARDDPGVPDHRLMLANTCQTIGFSLRRLGRPADALPEAKRSAEILEQLRRDFSSRTSEIASLAHGRVLVASLYAALGRVDDARREYEHAAAAYRDVPNRDIYSFYNEPCAHAKLCALSPADAPAEAARHADDAVRTLARSVAAGLRNPSMIRDDADFAPLRGRPDFQGIIDDAAFPDDPFAP
jgi:hypothetical protein